MQNIRIVLKKDNRTLFELTGDYEWISVELLTSGSIELVNSLRDFWIRESEKAIKENVRKRGNRSGGIKHE